MACECKKTDFGQIQCSHRLLDVVHFRRIFKDSKTFVDMNILRSLQQTSDDFESLMELTQCKPPEELLQKFLDENFETIGEIEDWIPRDFKENPAFLDKIVNEKIKKFAAELVKIWPKLARKVKDDVFDNQSKYTLVPVPNGFVVPGGRFKEIYYWDCLWIIKGLLLSEMFETSKGILENCFHLVETYGFVPNGNRVYYLNRSQPPVLTMTVAEYLQETNDVDWLRKNIGSIEKELNYWVNEKSVVVEKDGKEYVMAHYTTNNFTPRPESYFEDIQMGSIFELDDEKAKCYAEIRSSAESGWDFSSRWIFDSETYELSHTQTTRVVPVDLNSFLCKSYAEISKFFHTLGDEEKCSYWKTKSDLLQIAIEEVLYDEKDGIWHDFDLKLGKIRREFYTSNFTPLWAETYDLTKSEIYGGKAVEYLKNYGIMEYQGGIPTSLIPTGQQWDFPNSWAPFQDIVITGLYKSGHSEAQEIATELAKRWITANMIGFEETHAMFEKYDARFPGKYGGGGEYEVQSGFGWTNGVALKLINQFYTKE